MRLYSLRVTSRAASEDWQAAQIISNIHPEGPAAVPDGGQTQYPPPHAAALGLAAAPAPRPPTVELAQQLGVLHASMHALTRPGHQQACCPGAPALSGGLSVSHAGNTQSAQLAAEKKEKVRALQP